MLGQQVRPANINLQAEFVCRLSENLMGEGFWKRDSGMMRNHAYTVLNRVLFQRDIITINLFCMLFSVSA